MNKHCGITTDDTTKVDQWTGLEILNKGAELKFNAGTVAKTKCGKNYVIIHSCDWIDSIEVT